MREGLRRALSATPLRESISERPPWTPEVLFYVEIFGQGLPSPAPDRMDSASCSESLVCAAAQGCSGCCSVSRGLVRGRHEGLHSKVSPARLLTAPD